MRARSISSASMAMGSSSSVSGGGGSGGSTSGSVTSDTARRVSSTNDSQRKHPPVLVCRLGAGRPPGPDTPNLSLLDPATDPEPAARCTCLQWESPGSGAAFNGSDMQASGHIGIERMIEMVGCGLWRREERGRRKETVGMELFQQRHRAV